MVAVGMGFNSAADKKNEDAFIHRQTTETICNVKGVVRKIGNNGVYMIYCKAKHLKLHIINLPEKFKVADMPVVFSGNIKQTHPMEDDWGELFEVTNITGQ